MSGNNHSFKKSSHWLMLFSLIFAGEMIFSLPFHVARFFRPTLLESFSLTNTQLGDTFAFYGVTAMLCYFPGGVIADYFSARRLLTFSLVMTALGGIYFAQFPQGLGLTLLFGYWGITTILLFWAGMLKATREWGGEQQQGKAFGLLDGGRGLVAALMSSISVMLFAASFSTENSQSGMQVVIVFYSLITLLAATFTWFFVPEEETKNMQQGPPWAGMKQAMYSSTVWLQAIIVVCAYSGFKGSDNYGLYAVQVLSMDEVEAASFTSITAYLRPVGAIAAGFLADRYSASKITLCSFALLTIVYALLSFSWVPTALFNLAMFNLIVSYLAVFALRGVYFALVEESKISLKVTGTAVGFISLVGFTPDVFFASISGRLLDLAPGAKGFEYFFLLMMGIAVIGLVSALLLNRAVSLNKIELAHNGAN
jgi:nitrate/nitrite transporter NarK